RLPHHTAPLVLLFFLHASVPHRHVSSFPTRRSSDLNRFGNVGRLLRGVREELALHLGHLLRVHVAERLVQAADGARVQLLDARLDRKSTRLNSSHVKISYAVFCLKKKKKKKYIAQEN